MSSSTAPTVAQLLGSAVNEDNLSVGSHALLTANNMGDHIANALNTPALHINQPQVVLLSGVLDDSTSIRMAGNTQAVRDGANILVDALTKSKQQDNIFAMMTRLNAGLISPYVQIVNMPKIDDKNYVPNGGTPLYDRMIETCGAVIAKTQDFLDRGVPVRTITIYVTDGEDMGSKHTAAQCKQIHTDMLRQENHIIALFCIEDGHTDFDKLAESVGVPANWVITSKSTESEIRKNFEMVSQSAVRASQSAASFSQQALAGLGGGFTAAAPAAPVATTP
jgi:hypothetical protein